MDDYSDRVLVTGRRGYSVEGVGMMKIGALTLWTRTNVGTREVAGWHNPNQERWLWVLYASGYNGFGFRFVNVRDETFRRRNIFFDIPVIGGLSLFIQDVP